MKCFKIFNEFTKKIKKISNCCYRNKELNLRDNVQSGNIYINGQTTTNIILPQYSPIMRIGSGGNSVVYKAQDKRTKNIYTYKRVNKTSAALREIKVLKRLPNNKYFPKYKDHIIDRNKISIITEYIEGVESFEWIKTKYCDKKIQMPRIIINKFLKDIITAVYLLNKNDICHLDIKFENIILQNSSYNNILKYNLVLIDYGMAHPYTNTLDKVSCTCGTIGYTPYEIYQGYYHKNSDIWAIGVCLWIMLTGEMPFCHSRDFYGGGSNINKKAFLFPNEYHLLCKDKFNINDEYFYLVKNMLQLSYNDRPSVDELLEYINENQNKCN